MERIKNLILPKGLPVTFTVFYAVGLVLFAVNETRSLFFYITPFTLLLVAFAVFYYHKEYNIKLIIAFLTIFLASFTIEAIGVATGKLFGSYNYLSTLGIKIFDTPILIGINWLLLIYCSRALITETTKSPILKILGGSLLMVFYDLVLEIAAPIMKMWEFKGTYPPFQNFLMWFIVSLAFHSLLSVLNINIKNRPARYLFIIQILFFALIIFFDKLFN